MRQAVLQQVRLRVRYTVWWPVHDPASLFSPRLSRAILSFSPSLPSRRRSSTREIPFRRNADADGPSESRPTDDQGGDLRECCVSPRTIVSIAIGIPRRRPRDGTFHVRVTASRLGISYPGTLPFIAERNRQCVRALRRAPSADQTRR